MCALAKRSGALCGESAAKRFRGHPDLESEVDHSCADAAERQHVQPPRSNVTHIEACIQLAICSIIEEETCEAQNRKDDILCTRSELILLHLILGSVTVSFTTYVRQSRNGARTDVIQPARIFQDLIKSIQRLDPVVKIRSRPVPVSNAVEQRCQFILWNIGNLVDEIGQFWVLTRQHQRQHIVHPSAMSAPAAHCVRRPLWPFRYSAHDEYVAFTKLKLASRAGHGAVKRRQSCSRAPNRPISPRRCSCMSNERDPSTPCMKARTTCKSSW